MPTSAERFYEQMSSLKALTTLEGKSEDADFDCKEWPVRPEDQRRVIAKAACGFANATGGVIVIGVKASGAGANTPDVVRALAPVDDRHAVASTALEIILQSVEMGIEGIQIKTIADAKSKPSGFVLVFVPASEGAPRRTKTDWRFYVRIASGTLPMELFQIVCFRQSCVIEEAGLFLLGWSGEDAAHGGASDIETASDLGFTEARAA
jgi:predicted HTH transcriptional regulator